MTFCAGLPMLPERDPGRGPGEAMHTAHDPYAALRTAQRCLRFVVSPDRAGGGPDLAPPPAIVEQTGERPGVQAAGAQPVS